MHRVIDAFPATDTWDSSYFGWSNYRNIKNFATVMSVDSPSGLTGNRAFGLNDFVARSAPASWSGYSPFWALPCIALSTRETTPAHMYLGDYPNVRLLEMSDLAPQQVLSLSSDDWMVFPVHRQEAWSTASGSRASTGQYGLAYKKVT